MPVSDADGRRHLADTLRAGRGLCDVSAVGLLVRKARDRVRELADLGVKFERTDGKLKRTLEAGHSVARIVYNRDATGKAIEHQLVSRAREQPNLRIIENSMLLDLIVHGGMCIGGTILGADNAARDIFSKFTVLATGGAGQLYEKTTNPEVATGDGFAIAARAGAALENMEFVQFHPTKLDVPSRHPFLISEVLRGEGGVLVNGKGEAFMKKYDSKGELAPRDVVARAIYLESRKGKVYLDMTHKSKSFLQKRFPTIYSKCLGYDIDLWEDLVPVTAAAHYMCGGVKTDLHGRTSVKGLYAIGEVACTGVHGANRLASNSLLEGLVFAHEACEDAGGRIKKIGLGREGKNRRIFVREGTRDFSQLKSRLKKLMWEKVGVIRSGKGLRDAIAELRRMQDSVGKMGGEINYGNSELRNMLQTSMHIAAAALKRKGSLGCHFIAK